MDTRPSQALSGWQRWLGGKILLVQVTEGKMYLENRGWEGLTKHQDKWGRENKQKKKKKKFKSPSISFGAFSAVTLMVLQVQCIWLHALLAKKPQCSVHTMSSSFCTTTKTCPRP